MANILWRDCQIVGEDKILEGDVRACDGRFECVGGDLSAKPGEQIIEAKGQLLLPGLIDDQVHFRQPGLTHKADIFTESRAAAAGGITSFMDMPNVKPPTLSMKRLEEKRALAATDSLINYAFYLGVSHDNLAAVRTAEPRRIAGVKIFMGASTGDMLVDDENILRQVFKVAPTLIATHCESSPRIADNLQKAQVQYDGNIPPAAHPLIRDAEACYQSSSLAIRLATETGARLHILHISTAKELSLFAPGAPTDKQITAEACVHHLLFDEADYATLGMRLKTNPAVKTRADREALRRAVAEGRIDVLATDHAPHLLTEKDLPYQQAAAGLPQVEYALPALLELVADGALTYPQIATRGAAAVADIFAVRDRGRIAEGYWADCVLVKKTPAGVPVRDGVLSKCGWTPFVGRLFRHQICATFVNGGAVWQDGKIQDKARGMALEFAR